MRAFIYVTREVCAIAWVRLALLCHPTNRGPSPARLHIRKSVDVLTGEATVCEAASLCHWVGVMPQPQHFQIHCLLDRNLGLPSEFSTYFVFTNKYLLKKVKIEGGNHQNIQGKRTGVIG